MEKLVVSNLSKTYENGVKALQNVTLEIPTGMFGLLGPNGAGKSTLMRTIATLQEPDDGSVMMGDINVLTEKLKVRRVLGYLPQEFGLYPKMTAETLLNHFAILKGISDSKIRKEMVHSLLVKTNLFEDRKRRLGGFSGGMKQRFGIAQALLNNPLLLIVDEPTAGLDPLERNRFHNLLCKIAQDTIVILSTHIVEDVKELCPNMAIINKGQVLLYGNPEELISRIDGKIYRKSISTEDLEDYEDKFMVIATQLKMGQPVIRIYSDCDPGEGFERTQADLEDVYFSQLY